jgi:hypothetical protein
MAKLSMLKSISVGQSRTRHQREVLLIRRASAGWAAGSERAFLGSEPESRQFVFVLAKSINL